MKLFQLISIFEYIFTAPDPVENLNFSVTPENLKNQTYFVSATWSSPVVLPDMYLIAIDDNPDGERSTYFLPGVRASYLALIFQNLPIIKFSFRTQPNLMKLFN